MLGKLLKHELAVSARIIPIFYLAAAGMALLIFASSFLQLHIVSIFLCIPFVLICAGAPLGTYVVIAVRYHQSLFGREGYLTQTLPISKSTLLLSRTLLAFFWLVCSLIVCFAGIFLLPSLLGLTSPTEIWESLYDSLYAYGDELLLAPLAYTLLSMITQGVLSVSIIFFVITFSNTRPFIKNNILFSIVWYLAFSTAISLVKMIAMLFLPLNLAVENGHLVLELRFMVSSMIESVQSGLANTSMGLGGVIVDIIGIAVLFPLTNWMLKKKTSVR